MYEHFTDAENTGAPLVPDVQEPTEIAADGGRPDIGEYEEIVLSHRIES